jgi:hypothetical protein
MARKHEKVCSRLHRKTKPKVHLLKCIDKITLKIHLLFWTITFWPAFNRYSKSNRRYYGCIILSTYFTVYPPKKIVIVIWPFGAVSFCDFATISQKLISRMDVFPKILGGIIIMLAKIFMKTLNWLLGNCRIIASIGYR